MVTWGYFTPISGVIVFHPAYDWFLGPPCMHRGDILFPLQNLRVSSKFPAEWSTCRRWAAIVATNVYFDAWSRRGELHKPHTTLKINGWNIVMEVWKIISFLGSMLIFQGLTAKAPENRLVFQPSIFRCELLVLGWVFPHNYEDGMCTPEKWMVGSWKTSLSVWCPADYQVHFGLFQGGRTTWSKHMLGKMPVDPLGSRSK